MFNIGTIYVKGENGIEKDLEEAVRHFRLAARKGDKMAQFCLGMQYRRGLGESSSFQLQQESTAIMLFSLSLSVSTTSSMNCHPIQGVEQNDKKAIKYLIMSAEQGHAKAMHNLAVGRGGLSSGT